MLAFWRYGYETTSVAELTAAMGITAPSLYTAFGDKKHLFLEAMRLYAGDPEDMARAISDAPTAYDAARDLMTIAAATYTGESTPTGVSARQRNCERVGGLCRRAKCCG